MTEEQQEQIKAIVGEDKQFLVFGKDEKASIISNGDYIPKAKFNEVNESNKELKSQINGFTDQIESLKSSVNDSESLNTKIVELQNNLTTNETKYQESITKIKKENALNEVLLNSGATKEDNRTLLKKAIDLSKLELDESGKLRDADKIVNPLKETYKSLFSETVLSGLDAPKVNQSNQNSDTISYKEYQGLTPSQRMDSKVRERANNSIKQGIDGWQ